ncbi:Ig-like domain-containing protein, partial [Streptomyces sp. TRM66268-LWL]
MPSTFTMNGFLTSGNLGDTVYVKRVIPGGSTVTVGSGPHRDDQSFSISVNLGSQWTNTSAYFYVQGSLGQTSSVLLYAPSTAPVARADSASTEQGTAVEIPVLANDSGTGLSLVSVTDPANGGAEIKDGKVLYTPDDGFVGADSFEYTVRNSAGITARGNVSVTVTDPTTSVSELKMSSGDGQEASAGSEFADPLVTQALKDSSGVHGAKVTYQITDDGGTGSTFVDGGTSVDKSTDSQGYSSVKVKAGSKAGSVQVRATANGHS